MKRILLTITALLLAVWTASAQKNLEVGAVFDGKVVPRKVMKETFIKSSALDPFNLEQYHSVSFSGDARILEDISRRVLADAEKATDQEIHMDEGNLVYAILTFERANRDNQFVCYQCVSKEDIYAITMVYMHGPATLNDLKRLFKTKK